MALCHTTADPITAATMIARRISAGTRQQEQLPATPRVWDLRIFDMPACPRQYNDRVDNKAQRCFRILRLYLYPIGRSRSLPYLPSLLHSATRSPLQSGVKKN